MFSAGGIYLRDLWWGQLAPTVPGRASVNEMLGGKVVDEESCG
jgi:hypothetical protein